MCVCEKKKEEYIAKELLEEREREREREIKCVFKVIFIYIYHECRGFVNAAISFLLSGKDIGSGLGLHLLHSVLCVVSHLYTNGIEKR